MRHGSVVRNISTLLLSSLDTGWAAPAPSAPEDPVGASGNWVAAASEQIRRGEYHMSGLAFGDGWSAPNRAHDLRTSWGLGSLEIRPRVEGDDWSFRYQLLAVGRSGAQEPAAPVGSEWLNAGRLEWARDDVSEWYINDERGVEQGFVLARRPRGEGEEPVVIDGSIEGLLAYPAEDFSSVLLRTAAGRDALRIRDLVVTDARGRELAACFDVGDGVLRIVVDDRDAVYPVTVDPLMTNPAWTAESNQASAEFGWSVATAGDVDGDGYNDVIVGARSYDNGESNEGRAFVFRGSASGLATTAAWTGESNQAGASFGESVATAGDVNGDGFSDVIVGASQYNNGEASEGRVYVYHGSASGLLATAAWTAESNQASAFFGESVATAGDVDGDGYSDVIVGATSYDNGETNEGRASLYYGSGSGLSSAAGWTAESNQASAIFGLPVSSAGDVNGDGYGDVIVGAYRYDNGETDEGRAFVYLGSPAGLSGAAAWTAEGNQAAAAFGLSVSTAGDSNGDGYSDVIVSARLYDNGQNDEGRAFVYHGSASGLATSAAWTVEGNQADAWFSYPVALAGDINGDGYSDVIVAAAAYDNGEINEGSAFVYHGSASGLSSAAAWTAEGNQANANLGWSSATAGDVNGDGYSDVIVGAYRYSNGEGFEGRAYVYHGSPSGLATGAGWTAESNQAGAQLGLAIATAGDVNGDGYSDFIVGAPSFDNGQTDEGRAFVYHGSAAGLSAAAAWTTESNQASALYGTSVATAGDVNADGYSDVIVGAPEYGNGETGEGRAFVYHGASAGLSTTAAWTAESNQANASLGQSAAAAGDVNGDGYGDVIVGAPEHDNGESDEGRVFVYLGSSAGLAAAAAATREPNQAGAGFGLSVGAAGDVNRDGFGDVVVGAPLFDNGQTDEGRVYVYHGIAAGIGVTPARTLEANQAGAHFGASVATAGDVNGDGFSDVTVGAPGLDSGETDEGRAYVYVGSTAGIPATAAWKMEGNQVGAAYGAAVATAGDVNDDGYSDLIVGASRHDNGETDEGGAFVYHGSASGLATAAAWTAESNQAGALFGTSVATAGDVNGDGFSDVVVGAPGYGNGESTEGRAFLHYGNGGAGLDRNLWVRRLAGTEPLDLYGRTSENSFRVRGNGRTPFGRGKVRLEVEVKPLATAFDGSGLNLSDFSDTGAPGAAGSVVALGYDLPALAPTGMVRWRARLRTRAPFPWQSPWASNPRNAITEGDLRILSSDLLVTAVTVPATSGAGKSVTVSDTTQNNGSGTAAATVSKVWLSLDSVLDASEDSLLGNRAVPQLGPGVASTGNTVVTIPSTWPTAASFVIVQADGNGLVRESNEANNLKNKPIKIGPDLQITAIGAPTSASVGSTINVTDTTKDIGGGDAPASSTGFYLSTDTAFDDGDTRIGTRAVPALAAGASSAASTPVVIPSWTPPGSYFLIAAADDAQAVIETNETNNIKTKAITINP